MSSTNDEIYYKLLKIQCLWLIESKHDPTLYNSQCDHLYDGCEGNVDFEYVINALFDTLEEKHKKHKKSRQRSN